MISLLIDALRPLRFRGKVRLLSPLLPKTGQRTASIFGTRVRLDLADLVQRCVYLGGFERDETRLMERELKPGGTFVDIGANCGYYTYLAVRNLGPAGRVLAVEPSPYVADIIEAAIRDNHLKTVSLVRTALGPGPGELTLYVPPAAIANHAPSAVPRPDWSQIRVPVQRLDDLLDEQGIPTVDVLKIDVEGYEGHVFDGAEKSLKSGRIRAMLVEFNEWCLNQAGTSAEALWARITAYGFKPEIVKPSSFTINGAPLNCYFRYMPEA